MAILNFPPATGEEAGKTYEANGVLYTWDGYKWEANSESAFDDKYVNIDGDTMTGNLTVPNLVSEGDVQTTSLNGGQLAGFRNQIINGDFSINQRSSNNTNITTFTTQSYVCDRWTVQGNTNNNTTPIDQVNIANAGAQPKGFPSQIKLSTTSSGLSIVKLGQPIELPVAGQSYPFVSGSQWTLSFWASEDLSAQTASSVLFRDSAFASLNEVTAASGAAYGPALETEVVGSITWYKHSYTYTISNTAASTNTCAMLQISAPAGGTIRFTGIQLEPGPVATPFEHRPIGTELALCQRYYQKARIGGKTGSAITRPGSGQKAVYDNYMPPVPFRVTATTTLSQPTIFSNANSDTTSSSGISEYSAGLSLQMAYKLGIQYGSGSNAANAYGWQVTVIFDAEL